MNRFIKLTLIFLFLSIDVFAKEQIVWFQNQRPPWMINSGDFQNQGYGDKIREHFESILHKYNHKIIPINTSRFLKEMNKYENLCYGPIMRVPFLINHFHWSKPIYAIPKQEIIVLESTFKKLGSPKELSIEELLKNENYIFGKLKNLDHYPMEKFKNQKNILEISTMASTTNLLDMMQKKRVDWIYDFPLYLTWHDINSKRNKSEIFKTIKIQENQKSNKIIAHMICKKNDFGKKVIKEIDKHINKELIIRLRAYVRQWQPNQNNVETFDKINYEIFKF